MRRRIVSVIAVLACTAAIGTFVASIGCTKATVTERKEMTPLIEATLTPEDMNLFAEYMDPEILTEVNEELGSATPYEFLDRYIDKDPEFAEVLERYGYTTE
uniref:hypothetical protein n=1 Tax=Lachnoclostridium phocaeense TaxID=1871021 RepID=UPI0026DB6EC5|nr:hypothetical protein [Lachnoclostridium phocaeense]